MKTDFFQCVEDLREDYKNEIGESATANRELYIIWLETELAYANAVIAVHEKHNKRVDAILENLREDSK